MKYRSQKMESNFQLTKIHVVCCQRSSNFYLQRG